MPVNPFGKKKLQKELREQRDLLFLKQQQEVAQQWKERQLQDQLIQAEQQLEIERQSRVKQLEKERREQERVKWERREAEQKEKERKEREQVRMDRLKQTSPEALRGLRDLIRARYQLDMEIWSLKGARKPDQPIVEEMMEKADAILMEIYTMVETWEENGKIWTPQEWELAQDVKRRILAEDKRWWENNPPWNGN